MASVSEMELRQKISELVIFVRDFAVNTSKDIKVVDKRDGFILTIYDKDVTLDFSL